MEHDILARTRFIPISAQKVRLIVDLVRGKKVLEALDLLKFTPNQAAHPVSKAIASAVANGEENFGVSRDDLYIYRILPTRPRRANGAGLVHAVVSNPGCAGHRISPLSYGSGKPKKEKLWVVKLIQSVFV